MNAYRNIAIRAANRAGDFIAKSYIERDRLISKMKSHNDYVTSTDTEAEQLIIDAIHTSYPEHSILAEESGTIHGSKGPSDIVWVIDPLDGTRNFMNGIPHFSISIAVKIKNKTVAAVIYDPIRDEMFSAANGEGAQLNKTKLRVSNLRKMDNALLATGFPFRDAGKHDEYFEYFKTLLPLCSDMRRAGSAALDLAYVAAGRIDGFWEFGLSPWDTAAGILLVKEAGGLVGDIKGNPFSDSAKSILAANPGVFKHFMQTVKSI